MSSFTSDSGGNSANERKNCAIHIGGEIQGVHKVFRQLKKIIDITTDVGNV